MASPAGLASMKPCAIAHRKTVLIRWRTLRAVSGGVVQIGVRTRSTQARSILSRGMLPSVGIAWRSRVWIQAATYLALRQRGMFA